MKSFKMGIVIVMALVMAALGLMGCSSDNTKLISITVTPTDPVSVCGERFTATGTFSDGKTFNYTSEVTWSSSNPTVATVYPKAGLGGYVTVLSAGITTITAVEPYNHFTSSSLLTIVTPSAITITPEKPVMANGQSHQFIATATYLLSDMTTTATQSLMSSSSLTWISSNTSIATVSRGLVKTVGVGSVDISANDMIFSGVSGTTTLVVTPGRLKSIAVIPSPANIDIVVSPNVQLTATGTYDDFTTLDLTSSVEWSSSHIGTVVVSDITGSKGFVTAVAVGTATIKATDPISKITGTATVTVTSP